MRTQTRDVMQKGGRIREGRSEESRTNVLQRAPEVLETDYPVPPPSRLPQEELNNCNDLRPQTAKGKRAPLNLPPGYPSEPSHRHPVDPGAAEAGLWPGKFYYI